MRACVRACVCMRVCVCVYACMRARVCVYVARWCCHFSGMLNVTSQFSQECVDRMSSLEVCTDLDDPPGRRS